MELLQTPWHPLAYLSSMFAVLKTIEGFPRLPVECDSPGSLSSLLMYAVF